MELLFDCGIGRRTWKVRLATFVFIFRQLYCLHWGGSVCVECCRTCGFL